MGEGLKLARVVRAEGHCFDCASEPKPGVKLRPVRVSESKAAAAPPATYESFGTFMRNFLRSGMEGFRNTRSNFTREIG
jgi:hypothetical protein